MLRKTSTLVVTDPHVSNVTDDEEDDIVLGTEVAADAQYIVTSDHGLLRVRAYAGVSIVTAREFLASLDAD